MRHHIKKLSNLSNKNVLVTGGTGFIGINLVKKLIELDNNVFLLSRNVKNVSFINCVSIQCDIMDRKKLKSSLKNINIDIIFHLAGISNSLSTDCQIIDLFNVNVIGFGNICEIAISKNVKQILMTSSTLVYGLMHKTIIDENDIPMDTSEYACSKIGAELFAKTFHHRYKIPISICRLGQVYGPEDENKERLVPTIINALLKSEKPILKSSLDTKVNLLYIEDAVYGLLYVGNKNIVDEPKFDIVNINTENSYTIFEIFSKLKSISHSIINIEKPNLDQESLSSLISNHKLKNIFNWDEKTSIDDGLKFTFNYYKKRL